MTNNEALLIGIVSGLLMRFGDDHDWKVGIDTDSDGNYEQPVLLDTGSSTYEITVKEVKND